mmetsp:Transcript_2295/g.4169  ORF Transcript_2295/g.4169 Transcript_2295/m.4169 type:complete len:232 (-) Transcript_2295:60-755(-)|eukprot:CAMPEP_0197652372 /NCGR_PEP_ID=MMETSP1338-20131121/34412_1 /TAXON_ID=43686 ORGANISM="Pelagodinium beii, Strain RCC1491" /NCGR_SAMPLE_ID=MMETSP1338 /ASSEMBLY_ACC=CAM_ASM_000754 /LENGTH=231 /DNA_ID=CAMNT_0043227239 /DNA_START=62 /DNA_END=757 /DNA_ORIENTATION=-
MATAYSPGNWTWFTDGKEHLKKENCSYLVHAYHTLRFSLMAFVAGSAGFAHAFVAWATPFVAEEVGVELCTYIEEKRAQEKGWPEFMGSFYALSPSRWLWYIDGLEHVKFSGGSYKNHGKFACWASGQFYVAALCGIAHAILPFILPFVSEDIVFELGTLIKNRRKLRNVQKDNTFKNPENLSDYFNKEYEQKFAEAANENIENIGRVGDSPLDKGAIANQIMPGEKPRFL